MTALTELQQKQVQQAEELLFSGPQRAGFAKELFFGRFREESIFPAPALTPEQQAEADPVLAEVAKFAREQIDPDAIDRKADIPAAVIRGLGDLGVLGMTVGKQYGGRGMSQQVYCRAMEILGGRCASTAVFVNAHHSIGLRALELFGTPDQRAKYMPPLASGQQVAAFALTEPDAGSDAANVQTRAEPTPDGKGYLLNGQKRYITNAAIAQVLTVMARTPDPKDPDGKVTAFLVTPDMPGFEVVEARMEKCGIRGTATARLAFHDMFVPKENILGQLGKGLKLALTVLDFGRTTFGASCTGAAKFCLQQAVERANSRRQFEKSIGEFELIRQKIALAAADTFAMESATYHTAALIDGGAEDYMLETAMLKVFASDALWRIVNDTLQIWGGAGYFTDQPFERMMRDARINLIGEGANEVLRSFVCMVGLRDVIKQMEALKSRPWQFMSLRRPSPRVLVPDETRFTKDMSHRFRLEAAARSLSLQIGEFGRSCRNQLIRYRESILDRQLVQARLGDVAIELFMSSCVYARLCGMLGGAQPPVDLDAFNRDIETGMFYLQTAERRNRERLLALGDNDDEILNRTAASWLSAVFPA